jgi:hypothetical protein
MDLPSPATSLRHSIEERFGAQSVRSGFVKRNLVTTQKHLGELIQSYLDERKKSTAQLPADITAPDYAKRIVAGTAPQRPGIDYVGGKSGIRVFGFLRQTLLKAVGSEESNLSDEDIIGFLKRWWSHERANHKKKAYHIIFSLDPRLAARLAEKGISADDVLHSCVAEALLVYNNRYYPDSSLGWITGIHHDRHHTHAHVLLFPETSKGRGLNISRNAPVILPTHPPKQIRVDFRQTLIRAYMNATERHLAPLTRAADPDSKAYHQTMVALGGAGEIAKAEMAANGHKLVIKDILHKVGDLFKTADALTRINQHIPKLVATERTGGTRRLQTLEDYEATLRAALRSHQMDANLIRAAQEKTDNLFRQWRESPDRYRMVQYAKDTPPLSPSGTSTFLKGLIRNQSPAWPEIQKAVSGRLERLDSLLAQETSLLPGQPVIGQPFSESRILRAGEAFYIGRQLLLTFCRLRGLPPPSLDQPPLTALPNFSLEDAHRAFLSQLNAIAKRIGIDHHSASFQELIALYQRARVLLRAGLDPNDESLPLVLPATPSLVPTSANFLERESHHKGIRSLKDIEREQEELLRRISDVLMPETPPNQPRTW